MGERTCSCGKPRGRRSVCEACYRLRHKERRAAYAKQYYLDNKDFALEYARLYRADHPEVSAKWYQANKAAMKERSRELRQDPVRQERQREHGRRWRLKNPEIWAERNLANARRRRKIDGIRVDYAAILAEFGFVCHICSGVIESRDDLHMDHVVPLSKGGPHSAENIRPSHAFCNMSKGANAA